MKYTRMSQLIQSLKITGFKGFSEETDIPFANLTVLAGANSVGKSSVIQALLLSRMTMGDGSRHLVGKIALNNKYLLSLGNTRQIANKKPLNFSFDVEGNLPFSLSYAANVDSNFLQATSLTDTFENTLAMPNFHYLNAERIGPRPLHENTVSELPNTGFQGEFTIQLLVDGLDFDTESAKNFHKVTNLSGISLDNLTEQANLWMEFVIPNVNISANRLDEINRSVAKFNTHTPPNVGFGISYVLPIIVGGLIAEKGSMFIVENPEAHLHPFGQSRIGQFLAMVAASGVQVLVETHSEHVVNGMRVAAASNIINKDDFLINFLSKDETTDKISVKAIKVNDFGDFSDFPNGFFDQAAQDLLKLTKIRRFKK
jgi:predicted ATPase